ncbi:Aldo/keto reductase [Parathielavia appendiculata]|uniref:Aldo/keto reductase n=1 Tax=Parathielavia appendiculata TaxID=2587402 RepID=A0AAN6YYY6_9PEZI|nr:Aldo/keto reductase [Parathielavia appendiculata]
MMPQAYFPLGTDGSRIPSIGLGTFQPDPKLYPTGTVKQSVLTALRAGYRHIDTSLRESGIPREEIFVNVFHAPEDVQVNLDMDLENLGLDYVPYAYKETGEGYGTVRKADGKPVVDIELSRAFDITYQAMEKLVETGKVKHIGISNFSSPKVKRLLRSAIIKPAPQKGLVKLCQENGIHITAFGPLGCTPITALAGRNGHGPLENKTVRSVAEKYSRTPAQVLLCYLLCRGISVIPKSNNPERIVQNLDCLFDLDEEDFRLLNSIAGEDGELGV